MVKHICGFLSQDLVLYSTNETMSVQFFTDNAVNSAGFLASYEEADKPAPGSDVTENSNSSDEGYVLSFPQSFTVAEDAVEVSFKMARKSKFIFSLLFQEEVCLQLMNVGSNGKVEISLYTAKGIVNETSIVSLEVDHEAGDDTIHCYDLGLPQDFNKSYAVVGIKADFPDLNYK